MQGGVSIELRYNDIQIVSPAPCYVASAQN